MPKAVCRHPFTITPATARLLDKSPVKTPVKTRVKTPEAILGLLADKPTLTLAEVAAAVGKSVSAVERAAAKLAKDGRLKYTGPQKGGRWEVLG